jgi:hypothetical protein
MALFFKPVSVDFIQEEVKSKSWLALSTKGSNLETIYFLIGYLKSNLKGFRNYYVNEIPLRLEVYKNYINAIKSILENCNVSCFFTYQPIELNIPVEQALEDAIDYLETALLIEQEKEVNKRK